MEHICDEMNDVYIGWKTIHLARDKGDDCWKKLPWRETIWNSVWGQGLALAGAISVYLVI